MLPCVTDEIQRFLEAVKSMGYQDKPPYEKLRSILQAGLKTIQAKDDGNLEFTSVNGAVVPPAKVSSHTDRTITGRFYFVNLTLLLNSKQYMMLMSAL